jgi:membrane carboxypeptidase/penicillin-binding protein
MRKLSLREALTVSCNVATVRLNEQLGRKELAQTAKRLGIQSQLTSLPSLALGASEVSPLELAQAYSVFANGGRSVTSYILRLIRTRDGRVLYRAHPKVKPIVDPRITFLLTDALRDVVGPNGTAASVGAALDFPVAGKTGTTQSMRDAWFAGYTPDFVGVVYVGDDFNHSLPGGGGQLAAPIWTDFASALGRSLPARDFPIPDGIVSVDICMETGMLATPFCTRATEYYLQENVPKAYCAKHRRFTLRVCKESGLLPHP